MKKTLSLVLALAMVFSLLGVASAADFTDQADVQYTEAVGVMTGIGAIDGYADGTVNPAGSITREEAAKMVTYAILSKDVAEMLPVGNTGFTDVPAARWSSPFIAYCVNKGIINGMDEETFAPTEKVTAYQLAKMMLVALGYGKNDEFVGASWALNTAILGNKIGTFADTKATDLNKAATREEAMLYAFNSLTNEKAKTVTYSKDTSAYVKGVKTIAEEVYPNLKKDETPVNGVAGYTWTYGNKDVAPFVSTEDVVATLTGPITLAKFQKAYPAEKWADKVVVVRNGVQKTTEATYGDLEAIPAGVKVTLVSNATGKIAKVAIYVEYLGQVGTYNKAADTTPVTYKDANGNVNTVSVKGNPFTKGNVVLVAPKGDNSDSIEAISVKVAEKVTGTVEAFKADTSVTVAGNTYKYNAFYANSALKETISTASFTKTYNLYLDSCGFVIGAKVVSSADIDSNFFELTDGNVYQVASVDAFGVITTSYYAQVVAMDGTVSSKLIGVKKGEATLGETTLAAGTYTFAKSSTEAAAKLGVMTANSAPATYDKDTAPVYVNAVNNVDGEALKTTSTYITTDAGKAYITSGTEFIFVSGVKAALKVQVVSGGVNYKLLDNTKVILSKDIRGNNIVEAVIIGSKYTAEATGDMFFATGAEYDYVTANGYVYSVYDAKTGEKVTITSSDATVAKGFHTYTVENDVYDLSAVAEITEQTMSGLFGTKISSGSFTDAEAGEAMIVDVDKTANEITFDELNDFYNGTKFYAVGNNEKGISIIFVTDRAYAPEA